MPDIYTTTHRQTESPKVSEEKDHILVIRLGALGDLIFCFQSFHDIRQAHPNAEIALLTRAPFAAFARRLPWFDRVIIDTHPTSLQFAAWHNLVKIIKFFAPTRIYDLQGKRRQTILYTLLGGPFGPDWSGAAPLCLFPRPWPPTPGMSFIDFLAAQLRVADVQQNPAPDLSWFDAPLDKFALPASYVVFIPGSSPDALHKRWPAQNYAALAKKLQAQNMPCVMIGTQADADAVAVIKKTAPDIIDLCGKTDLFELAALLRRADGVIGNDTGPLHIAGMVGAPTLALFSEKSHPVWSKPPGPKVALLHSPNLADLKPDAVSLAFDVLRGRAAPPHE